MIAVTIGYLASAFLALSLIEKNSIRFRWYNIMGCLAFIVYGICIKAFPVILANSVLLTINIYQLVKLYNYKEDFQLVDVKSNDLLVQKFVDFYKDDIQQYFPDFNLPVQNNHICTVVLRDLSIANLFVAEVDELGNAWVLANYTTPNYRDYKIGKFIFEKSRDLLVSKGVKQVIYKQVTHPGHLKFITVTGFTQQPVNGNTYYVKAL